MGWSFLVTSLLICIAPGTGALYTVASGLIRGPRAGVMAAFACTLGTVPHAVAAITGVAALLHASGVAFQVIKYAGIAYLIWMAVSVWRDTGALTVERGEHTPSWRRVIYSGITLNLLNPKLTIFFFAFLPQFVSPGRGAFAQMVELSAVFMLMTFLTFVVYGVCAGALRDKFLSRPRALDVVRKVFAASFLGLGARLAAESR